MSGETGKWLIIFGLGLAVIGSLIYFFHEKLNWIGRLPGDIRIERENFTFYLPLTTMILASIVLTIVVRVIVRFLK